MFQPENSFVFRNEKERSYLSRERVWSAHGRHLIERALIPSSFTVEAWNKVLKTVDI